MVGAGQGQPMVETAGKAPGPLLIQIFKALTLRGPGPESPCWPSSEVEQNVDGESLEPR